MTPIFIVCDGLEQKGNHTQAENDRIRYKQYEDTLRRVYPPPRFTILVAESRLGLTGNVKQVMDLVTTEFVYVLQHDMPFNRPINHTAIIRVMRQHPDVVRLVRFNKRQNLGSTVVFDGVSLTKHDLWSDNNHLMRKSYYEEIFKIFKQSGDDLSGKIVSIPMEWMMMATVTELRNTTGDCMPWCTHLYGAGGQGPYIGHWMGDKPCP